VDREAVLVGLEVKVGSALVVLVDLEVVDLVVVGLADQRVDAVVDLVVKVVMRRSDLDVLMVLSA
jgi:hypothetical protein